VYWALMTDESSHADMPKGETIALETLMQQHDLTAKELEKLHQAKQSSDAVIKIEQAAMRLVEGDAVSSATRQQAMDMLYDATYAQAKLSIMRQIDAFYGLVETRTEQAVQDAIDKAFLLRVVLVLFVLVQLWWIWGIYRSLNRTLGADVDTLHDYINRLGRADFEVPEALSRAEKDSVMHWLAESQSSLAKTQQNEQQVRQYNQRLTQLYAALSQCNQAIVRCNNDNELFRQLCQIAVVFGGMKMAWIGVIDEDLRLLMPVAVYGEGVDYVSHLHISTDPMQLTSKGPIGQAILNDEPFWCQDFIHDANTAIWHDLGKQYGWGAVASLPLHRDGRVMGAFSLYSATPQAFDIEAKKLLEEMASDIDFALNRFRVETEREHFRVNLQSSEESSRLVLENAMDAVINMNTDGRVMEWSGAAEKIFGYTRSEAMGQLLADLIVPEVYRDAHTNGMRRLLATGESKMIGKLIEIVGMRRDGVEIPIELSITQIKHGQEVFFSAFIREITERKESEQHIQYLANYDPLTGLPNRNQLNERVKYAISLAHRNHNNLAIMFLDLDHFKDVNDTLGHSIGDRLLVELANRIIAVLREEDTVARFGGDEFIFLLPNVNEEGAAVVAQKLMGVIASPVVVEEQHLSVTASIGIAMYPDDGLDIETLLRNADVAMYKAKEESRSGYRFYTAAMQTQSSRNLMLVNALRQAIPLNQLEVYYQPQIALDTNQIIGVEALLRWRHPDLGDISPVEFIPIAESSGMIVCIGEWVLTQAVRQAKQWLEQGILNATVAVNLSVVQFRDPDLPNMVTRILAQEGLPAEYLELELTEGVALEDPARAIQTMDALHAGGVRLSIDDFGTGYSSLSHLKKFKINKLKIDRTFVRDISTDEEDKAIVMAIIQLAKSLALKTVAEGVETNDQLAFLRAQGCDEVQGFLYTKALPVDALELYIKRYH
jgi:diguanylate cyclase (GGDEF)-like protein/PAS domain S-box-containing protein